MLLQQHGQRICARPGRARHSTRVIVTFWCWVAVSVRRRGMIKTAAGPPAIRELAMVSGTGNCTGSFGHVRTVAPGASGGGATAGGATAGGPLIIPAGSAGSGLPSSVETTPP